MNSLKACFVCLAFLLKQNGKRSMPCHVTSLTQQWLVHIQDELRDELEDAKYLFGDVELTEKEKADLR